MQLFDFSCTINDLFQCTLEYSGHTSHTAPVETGGTGPIQRPDAARNTATPSASTTRQGCALLLLIQMAVLECAVTSLVSIPVSSLCSVTFRDPCRAAFHTIPQPTRLMLHVFSQRKNWLEQHFRVDSVQHGLESETHDRGGINRRCSTNSSPT